MLPKCMILWPWILTSQEREKNLFEMRSFNLRMTLFHLSLLALTLKRPQSFNFTSLDKVSNMQNLCIEQMLKKKSSVQIYKGGTISSSNVICLSEAMPILTDLPWPVCKVGPGTGRLKNGAV